MSTSRLLLLATLLPIASVTAGDAVEHEDWSYSDTDRGPSAWTYAEDLQYATAREPKASLGVDCVAGVLDIRFVYYGEKLPQGRVDLELKPAAKDGVHARVAGARVIPEVPHRRLLLDRLRTGRPLKVALPRPGAKPLVATFSTAGARDAVRPVLEACGLPEEAPASGVDLVNTTPTCTALAAAGGDAAGVASALDGHLGMFNAVEAACAESLGLPADAKALVSARAAQDVPVGGIMGGSFQQAASPVKGGVGTRAVLVLSGGVSSEALSEAVMTKRPALAACRTEGAFLPEGGEVRLDVAWDAEGTVVQARPMESDEHDRGFLRCVRRTVQGVQVPAKAAGEAGMRVVFGE